MCLKYRLVRVFDVTELCFMFHLWLLVVRPCFLACRASIDSSQAAAHGTKQLAGCFFRHCPFNLRIISNNFTDLRRDSFQMLLRPSPTALSRSSGQAKAIIL